MFDWIRREVDVTVPLCFVRHGCRSPSNGGAAVAGALAKWCKFQHMTLLASRLGRLLFRQFRMWSWPARRSGQIKRWLQVAKKAGADSSGQEVAPEQKKDVEVEVDWVPFHGISSNCKLDDGWPESEKHVLQAALSIVVVKNSR